MCWKYLKTWRLCESWRISSVLLSSEFVRLEVPRCRK
jgi:hypothetical protein